jgi:DNA-binding CsgD family transcriptional regulator
MKKTLLIVALLVLALGVVGVGVAFAQGGQPPVGQNGYGWMHDYVEQAIASKLNLTEKQVEDQLAAGKPMYQIALDNGIKQEDLATFMTGVHKDAVAKAVKAGVITQERADWMLQRMETMYQNGYGPGNCPMYNGQGAPAGRGRGGPGMMGGRGAGYGPGMMGNQGTATP